MARKWSNISIPADMAERAKKLVEHPAIKKWHDYGSVSELIRDVLADKMDELEKIIEKDEKKSI